MVSCNGCGVCCRIGGRCDVREWGGLTPGFVGRCELLEDQPNGATLCMVLANEPREVLELVVDGTCEFPTLRQDIGA